MTLPAANPDPRDFVRLLSAHERHINAYILALVPHWADAEDVAQETKVRLWEQFGDYDPKKDFGAWARTIAYYQVLTHRKQSARRHARLSDTVIEAVAQDAPQVAEEADQKHHALAGCLQKLSAATRELLMRYYSGRETMHEIAESQDKTYEAQRKAILRARVALAKCVDQALGEPS